MAIRVLIVDDAMFMRSMIKDILNNAGGRYEIVGEASNGREAIARYRELNPGLVTMDIVMPQLDGIEATREILKVDPAAVIVMCSAMGQEALVVESISAGAKARNCWINVAERSRKAGWVWVATCGGVS